MRLIPLLVTAMLAVQPARAQPSTAPESSPAQDQEPGAGAQRPAPGGQTAGTPDPRPLNLPVSLDKIKEGLSQPPALPLIGLHQTPDFKVATDSPLVRPSAAFNQPQLLTVLIGNLVDAVGAAARARSEAAARDEVRQAVAEFCAAHPSGGRGVEICTTPLP